MVFYMQTGYNVRAMKIWIAALVLLALAGIGFMVFGMGHGTCIAELANGRTCPNSSPFDYVNFHFAAFSLFSTAVFTMLSGILPLMLGLVLWIIAQSFSERQRLEPISSSVRMRNLRHNRQQSLQKHFWLSILEKRDPASF